jgi:hypothetical protein
LFSKKYSVCDAYELAKEDIRAFINVGEANKFKKFVIEDYGNTDSNTHV